MGFSSFLFSSFSLSGLSGMVAQVSQCGQTSHIVAPKFHVSSEREPGGSRVILSDLTSEILQHYFHHILFLKAVLKAHSVSGGGDIDSTSRWANAKIRQVHVRPEFFFFLSSCREKKSVIPSKLSIRILPKSHDWYNSHPAVAFQNILPPKQHSEL